MTDDTNHSESRVLTTLTRDMGLSRAEFLRSLPAAVTGYDCSVSGDHVAIRSEVLVLDITLGEAQVRRLGALTLPLMSVAFRFSANDTGEVDAFMARFDRAFQRGGG
jgi:hypothetical protein